LKKRTYLESDKVGKLNKYNNHWYGITLHDFQEQQQAEVRRHNQHRGNLGLKPNSEIFEIKNVNGGDNWSILRFKAVLDQPHTPQPDSIYLLIKKGEEYIKVFPNQFGDSIQYEPESQALYVGKINTQEAHTLALMQRQAPTVNQNPPQVLNDQSLPMQFYTSDDWIAVPVSYFFQDPDSLSNDLKVEPVQYTADRMDFRQQGDTVYIKRIGRSFSGASLTLKATHDQLELQHTFEIARVLGADDLRKLGVQIYPNPVNQVLKIELTGNHRQAAVQGYNLQGKQVLNQRLQRGKNEINVQHLARGTYLLALELDGKKLPIKIIKQ
jgi:hypothetical protein